MTLWREEFIPINRFSRPCTSLREVRNIVMHYTANPGASAANHVGYLGKVLAEQNPYDDVPDTYASAHLFVDRVEAVLVIPLDEVAYHASQANTYSIGVEMCIEQDGAFHPDTVRRTVEIVAELCERYGLDPWGGVIRHYDVTGKICPKPYVDDPAAWAAFRQEVKAAMEGVRLTDIDGHWAADAIKAVNDAGIMTGYEDGTFRPDRQVTRAELAKVVNDLLYLINRN